MKTLQITSMMANLDYQLGYIYDQLKHKLLVMPEGFS